MTKDSKDKDIKDFIGTKIALINNGQVLASLRDDKPNIDFPGMWDLPGGAREASETPFETVAREIKEELGITITQKEVVWERIYPAVADPTKKAVFMVIHISDEQLKSIVFGDEGQEWKMMTFGKFIHHKNAVSGMQIRLRDYLNLNKVTFFQEN